jgi:hypothetical protein
LDLIAARISSASRDVISISSGSSTLCRISQTFRGSGSGRFSSRSGGDIWASESSRRASALAIGEARGMIRDGCQSWCQVHVTGARIGNLEISQLHRLNSTYNELTDILLYLALPIMSTKHMRKTNPPTPNPKIRDVLRLVTSAGAALRAGSITVASGKHQCPMKSVPRGPAIGTIRFYLSCPSHPIRPRSLSDSGGVYRTASP